MLKALFKKQLLEIREIYTPKKYRGQKRKGSVGFIILYAFCLLSVAAAFVGMAELVCGPFHEMGLDWLYYLFFCFVALAVGIIGSVFSTYSTLYRAKDNELLLSMPIPPMKLLLVRMLSVFFMGFLFEAVVLLPAFGVHIYRCGTGVLNIAGCLLGKTVEGIRTEETHFVVAGKDIQFVAAPVRGEVGQKDPFVVAIPDEVPEPGVAFGLVRPFPMEERFPNGVGENIPQKHLGGLPACVEWPGNICVPEALRHRHHVVTRIPVAVHQRLVVEKWKQDVEGAGAHPANALDSGIADGDVIGDGSAKKPWEMANFGTETTIVRLGGTIGGAVEGEGQRLEVIGNAGDGRHRFLTSPGAFQKVLPGVVVVGVRLGIWAAGDGIADGGDECGKVVGSRGGPEKSGCLDVAEQPESVFLGLGTDACRVQDVEQRIGLGTFPVAVELGAEEHDGAEAAFPEGVAVSIQRQDRYDGCARRIIRAL